MLRSTPKNDMPLIEVNRMYRIISSQLSAVQAFGYSVCIQAPKSTLIFCFQVQKELLFLPFRCIKMAFDMTTGFLRRLRSPKSRPLNVAEILTGTSSPTLEQVQEATRGIRSAAIRTIVNQTSQRSRILQYRDELEKWSTESDKKIEDSYTLNAEDKMVVKSLAVSLKQLKALKAKKGKLSSTFWESVTNILSKDNINQEELKSMRSNIKNISAVKSEMEDKRNVCLSAINGSSKLSGLFTKIILQGDMPNDANQYLFDPEIPYNVSNRIQAVLTQARLQNATLKSNLAGTTEKLEEILSVTENIRNVLMELSEQFAEIPRLNNELSSLKGKLEQEQLALRSVQAERNDMKEKLEVLETLIENEENFLDSRSEDPPISEKSMEPTMPVATYPMLCLL